jgi:hypothetical protein
MAAVYLQFKKALDTAFPPHIRQLAERMERRAGRPKKTEETALETVKNAALDYRITDCRKAGWPVSNMAHGTDTTSGPLWPAGRVFNARDKALWARGARASESKIDRDRQKKQAKPRLRRMRIRAYLKERKSRQ